jgi:hypothetical protein
MKDVIDRQEKSSSSFPRRRESLRFGNIQPSIDDYRFAKRRCRRNFNGPCRAIPARAEALLNSEGGQ